MRILYLGLGWRFTGGISTFARTTVGALADWADEHGPRHGVEVMALHAERGSLPAARCGIERAGLSIEGCGGSRLRAALMLAARARRRHYDLIVCEHVNLMPLVAAAVPGAIPCVCFVYSFEIWYGLGAARGIALRRARKLIAISHAAAGHTLEMKLRLPPITVCHPGIEDPLASAAVEHPAVARPIVLTVGRMMSSERHKNHRTLIRAMVEVVAAVPEAMLVVVGEGDDRHQIAALGAGLGLDGHLLFTGAVDGSELDRWYRSARVFAMPAEREGFGLVYLEAMARGLPVIGGASGASTEIIDDGQNGFLVPPNDYCELAQRIIALLEDGPLRSAIGNAARARFLERFTAKRFAARLYEKLDLECAAAQEAQTETAA